jgi:hypothetical protein
MNRDYNGNELLPSSNLVTPQSHAGTSMASSRHVNTNPSFGGMKNNLVATAPHNRNLSDSRYSNMNTDGGLTYSASAVSEVSEQQEETINQSRVNHFINIDEVKIESKEHLWKPAPIVGREFTHKVMTDPEINVKAGLRGTLTNNYVS